MSLALETLVWNSDTSALEQAVKKIDDLSAAVTRLNKAQQEETKTAVQAEKLKQEEAKSATAVAKAKEAEAKAEQTLTKAKQSSAKASKEVTETTDANNKVLQRQKEMLEFMTQGYSRGQASTLAYAKATGAATTELNELGNVLKTQRKLIGGDVFDKSLSGLTALKNQLGEVREAYRQYGDNVELTRNQTRELARDKERIIERLKQEGASFTDIKNAIKAHGEEYIATAARVNSLINQEKELERQHRESANAARALAAEEERMFSVMQSMNSGLNQNVSASEKSAMAIARYERNLRLAGVGAQEAATKLALYKKQMLQVQEIEQTRRAQHLSRALTPQIADVVTSIAGGMPLHLVIMQQGLQIRDLINLSGVEMKKLQEVFRTASADMVKSLAGTAQAVGTLLLGSITSAGKTIANALWVPLRETGLLIRDFAVGGGSNFDQFSMAVTRAGVAIKGALGIIAGFASILGGVFLISLIQADNQQTALAKSIGQYGAALGVTSKQAMALAVSSKHSTRAMVEAISEVAKAGVFTKDQLKLVAESAIETNKVFGTSIADVVAQYKTVTEEPVKALLKLNAETGNVNTKIIESVQLLTNQGDKYNAVKIAMQEYAAANKRTTDATVENLGYVAKILNGLAETWREFYKSVEQFGKADSAETVLQNKIAELQRLRESSRGNPRGADVQRILALEREVEHYSRIVYFAQQSQELKAKEAQASTLLLSVQDKLQTKQTKYEQERAERLAEIKKAESLVGSGGITPETITRLRESLVKFEEGYKNSLQSTKDANKDASDQTKAYEKVLDDFQKMQVRASGTTEELSKAQTHLLNVMRGEEWGKFSEERKLAVLEEFKLAHAKEESAEAFKKQQKALEDLQKVFNKADNDLVKRTNATAKESAELQHRFNLLGKTEEQVKQLSREFQLQQKIIEINNDLYAEQINLLQEYAEAAKGLTGTDLENAARNLNTRLEALHADSVNRIKNVTLQASLEVLQEQEQVWLEFKDVIGESIWLGITGKGKDAVDTLKQYLNNQFKNFVMTVFINPIVGQMQGSFQNMMGMQQQGGGIGQLSQVGSLFSQGGISNAITSWLGAPSVAGSSSAGLGVMGVPGGVSTGTTATGIYAGGLGSSVIPGLAAYGFAQKYGPVGGMAGAVGSTALAGGVGGLASGAGFGAGATGALSAVPVWGWIAAAALAILGGQGKNPPTNFWQETTRNLTTGEILSQTDNPKSRRHSPENLAISDALSQYAVALNASLFALTGRTAATSAKFGIGSRDKQLWIDEVAIHEGDRFSRMTVEELRKVFDKEMLSRVFDDLSEEIKSIVAEIEEDGRALGDALGYVVLLEPVNKMLARLEVALFDVSLAGSDALQSLLELTGGMENLTAMQGNYYDKFFSDAEKVIFLNQDLAYELDNLGLGMVNSRDGFRELVSAQDLSTQAGREAYAGLLKLSPVMDEYLNLLDEQINGTESAKKASKAYIDSLNVQIKLTESTINRLSQLSQLLRNTLDSMRLGTTEETRMRRSVARSKVSEALATARATGVLPEVDAISPYLRTLTEPSEQLYSSFEDYARDFYLAKNDIFALAELTDSQLTVEERTLSWMKERAELENEQHEQALEQWNINNIMQEKQSELLQQIRSLLDTQGLFSSDLDPTKPVQGSLGVREYMTPEAIAAGTAALASIGVVPGGAITEDQAMLIYEAYKSGYAASLGVMGLSDIDQLLGQRTGTAEFWLLQRGLPAFANGGDFAGGWRKVGEFGPEVEFTPPSRIYNRNQMNSLIDTQSIVEELRELRSDVQTLERIQSATATNTFKSARALDEIVFNGVEVVS